MPVLVYLITGFLDSGKTSLIKETLEDPEFTADNNKSLIIQLEDGEISLTKNWLESHNAHCVMLEPNELNLEKITELNNKYKPQQVFIEYNGLYPVENFLNQKLLQDWIIVQILTTVDSTTFITYMNNLKSYMFDIIRYTQTILFNRINPSIKKQVLRNNIKAVNRDAQIVYINTDHQVEKYDITDLPFDITNKVIDIDNDDYGLWYMDALEEPSKYNEKEIILRGKFLEKINGLQNSFVLGRQAMVCCADDMQQIGLTVTGVNVSQMKLNSWYEVKGTLRALDRGDGRDTLVLYASKILETQTPAYELVNFN